MAQVPRLPGPSRPRCRRRDRRLQAVRGLARVRAFFNAPVVIFHLNILSYFSFLCLFAYVLMVDFQPSPSWCERLIYLWLFSLVCEELRQVRPTPPSPSLGGWCLPAHWSPPTRHGHCLTLLTL